ncbi:hypothetical protein ACFOON_15075 [Novosphingobium piscinae]|uniref:Uncharacterized protein n=1 Tax=Novosphingobium piscinae TaxID=1507448 RepID=A0A7X1FYP4_9SPHN|nr:hypothetical protein [Novosphingobium piscinae]MBC2668777.1 hypothetical protein [Novosphingobium piscinae]
MTDITDEDCQAAAEWTSANANLILDSQPHGWADFDGLLHQAFAKHRLAAEARGEARGAESERARVEGLAEALAKIMPIRVHNGQDYAEVYFADGQTHSTQAMTMNPQDWLDIAEALSRHADQGEGV